MAQVCYNAGQAVLKMSQRDSKFAPLWVGPYVVRERLSDCLYCVSDKKKTYVLHHDRLKPYDSDLPKWATRMQQEISKSVA